MIQGIQNSTMVFQPKLALFLVLVTLFFVHPDDVTVFNSASIFTIYSLILALQMAFTINFPLSVAYLYENRVNCARLQVTNPKISL